MEFEEPGRIEELWHAARPQQWGAGKHAAERKMLQDILIKDEHILAMAESTFLEPVAPFKRGLKLWGYYDDRGVALATDRRVLFLKHKTVGGDIAVELQYKSLTAIAETGGGDLSEGVILIRERDKTWEIAGVSPERAQVNFSDVVRRHTHPMENKRFPFS